MNSETWHACTLQLRMKKLEEIRLEVDSRRRTVADLSAKVEKQRARLPQTRAKGEDEMQNTIKTMQHKENKLAGAALAAPSSRRMLLFLSAT